MEEMNQRDNLKILLFHNTLPEYRIGWFQNLLKLADVKFVFTNEQLNKNNYGFDIDFEKAEQLDCVFLDSGQKGFLQLKKIMRNISDYDFVELPPIDSLREVIYSNYIVKRCKKENVKIGYFWEKWDAPISVQPFERRIKNLILRIIPRAIYKHADIIYYVGQKSKEYFISNGISEQKLFWIPDASETPQCEYIDIRKAYGIEENSKIIMYLGRVLPQKGVTYLIRAYHALPSNMKEQTHLLIAGDGEGLSECKIIAEELDVRNIIFAGAVNPKERGNFFSQCDLFVYPVTHYKGRVDVWGLTLNEALQHGKTLIATDAVGSAYELIDNGVNGYRIEPGNVEELTKALYDALVKLSVDRVMAKDLELAERFCFKNMAELYIKGIYEMM